MNERTLIDPNNTPRELWRFSQFVCWRYGEPKPGRKPPKIPVNPKTLANGGVSWPNTWSDIRTAVATYKTNEWIAGVGFVLTEHDPYTMIDLDNCLIDGKLTPFAANIVDRFDTYTELSPSGRGLRLFVQCEQQPSAIKQPAIELYSTERFATLTGNVLHPRPIAQVAELDWLIELAKPTVMPPTKRETAFSSRGVCPAPDDDQELWQRIFKHNHFAHELFLGHLDAMKRADHSVAVSLLLNSLALWTQADAGRMARMIRQTALDQTKFDQKRGQWTWLDARINGAIEYMKQEGQL